MEQKSCPPFFRWPWNVMICVLLVLFLRIFSIPFLLIFAGIQKKCNPHGEAEGYCLSRARGRLSMLLWAVLFFALAVALGVFFYVSLGQSGAERTAEDYVSLAVSLAGAAALSGLGVYSGFVALRDSFFPEKSGLAESIRNQISFPDGYSSVKELFAVVDRDLRENGRWFEKVGIGKEWVLGDYANRIDRIRGIFAVDEAHRRTTQTGVRVSRTLQLVLVDDGFRRNATDFKSPKELKAAAECIALKAPGARRGGQKECVAFCGMEEGRREAFEREFMHKKRQKELEAGGMR